MKTKIINTTPHDINVYEGDKIVRVIPPAGWTIRLEENTVDVGVLDGIPETETTYGTADLPEEKEGVYYIVSAMVKKEFPNRRDLRVPARTVRNEKNQIIGCRSIGR